MFITMNPLCAPPQKKNIYMYIDVMGGNYNENEMGKTLIKCRKIKVPKEIL